ncbi:MULTISPECIES: DedA family protein [unclassified Haladaptatus]|uniref:DedA family protein n=1 Tax=unclassified Haladaptatus TaxID=2622732 RepID=UPI0023E7D03F|nr:MULTISPECIES: VTT domain-containing protein [unclassified Haladaptatus]
MFELSLIPPELGTLGLEIIQKYGMVALFVLFILEGAMLLFIAPSESLVPVAIASMSTTEEYALVIVLSVAGATIGQYALFTLAKRRGKEYLVENRWFRVDEARIDTYENWFGRWGPGIVLLSNTLPFVRGLFTVPAGVAELSDREFVAYSALGTLCFETILAFATLGVLSHFG